MLTQELEREVSRVKVRIAHLAGYEKDFDDKELFRRLDLSDNITIYTLLHLVSEHTLIDVATNEISLEEVFEEHFSNSAVVWEFSVANGTNVRLSAGESIICLGKDEYVAMKLVDSDIVTYRDADSSVQLLQEVGALLAKQMLRTNHADNQDGS